MANGGTDGSDVTDMLHHGRQRDGQDGEEGADELRAAVDGEQAHGALMQRDAEPIGGGNGLEVHRTGHEGHRIGHQNADQDGQDLDHALAPDVADDDRAQRHKGQQPVGLAVGDGGGGKDQADGDDDGARDHRREELHDAADAEGGDQQTDHQIQHAGESHARTGVGQHLGVDHGQVAVSVCQHGGHDGVEQQGAQTCAQQGGGNAQAGEQRHQNGGTEHGEHVLHAEDQHPARAQLARVVNALGVVDFFTHENESSLRFCPKKEALPPESVSASDFWEMNINGNRKDDRVLRKVEPRIALSPSRSDFIKYSRNRSAAQPVSNFLAISLNSPSFFGVSRRPAAFLPGILKSGQRRTIIIPIKWIEI